MLVACSPVKPRPTLTTNAYLCKAKETASRATARSVHRRRARSRISNRTVNTCRLHGVPGVGHARPRGAVYSECFQIRNAVLDFSVAFTFPRNRFYQHFRAAFLPLPGRHSYKHSLAAACTVALGNPITQQLMY